jgi:hypothetical protein
MNSSGRLFRRALLCGLLAVCALALVVLPGGPVGTAAPRGRDVPPTALPLEDALKKARSEGKYEMLLRQIKVPNDFDKYQNFRDLGARTVSEYAGFKELPSGHWVYVYPYWYIWRDLSRAQKVKRNWGPEQATGAPDTWPNQGDIVTAWASKTPDGQREWLLLEYAQPVVPREVHVYETFNPGAVDRVTAFNLAGEEVEIWKGNDPTPAGSGKGISKIACKLKLKTNRIKVYINSPAVQGWNEIDAVGIVDAKGKTHWATSAAASSTFAE